MGDMADAMLDEILNPDYEETPTRRGNTQSMRGRSSLKTVVNVTKENITKSLSYPFENPIVSALKSKGYKNVNLDLNDGSVSFMTKLGTTLWNAVLPTTAINKSFRAIHGKASNVRRQRPYSFSITATKIY